VEVYHRCHGLVRDQSGEKHERLRRTWQMALPFFPLRKASLGSVALIDFA
jgi:hypothetical protein